MNVILLYNIKKLGSIGKKVNVKPGYARNYLFPSGQAIQSNKKNLKYFTKIKNKLKINKEILKNANKEKIDKINNLKNIVIKAKSGLEGKLFGSIRIQDIYDKIIKQGININKNEIKLPNGLLRTIGSHKIEIKISKDIIINFNVNIISSN
ncbi:MAG: 50S ribosomal protein L9 [Candidatus Makana argininalis]